MSTAATSVASPSSFATLLRRSKFASFDPRIGQIYATRGGHAHRGDWGIKRPLALRRKDGRITLQSIDTMYQQTEWKSAYNDSVSMKKFEEMGASVDVSLQHKWYAYAGEKTYDWQVDSDFAPRTMSSGPAESEEYYRFLDVPNAEAMNEKQLKAYIKRLREKREEFREYSRAQAVAEGAGTSTIDYDFSRLARSPENKHLPFISKLEQSKLESRKKVLRVPHPVAGLTYTHSPPLQQFFLKRALPGHRLQISKSKSDASIPGPVAHTSVAGFLGEEFVSKNSTARTTDFGTSEGDARTIKESGRGYFRATNVALWDNPEVVSAKPESLDQAWLKVTFQSFDPTHSRRSNPHMPGTKEYITYDEAAHARDRPSMSKAMTRQTKHKLELDAAKRLRAATESEKSILAMLEVLVDKDKSGAEKSS